MDPCSLLLAVGAIILWGAWYVSVAQVTPLASSHHDRLALYLAPPLCLLALAGAVAVQDLLAPLFPGSAALFCWGLWAVVLAVLAHGLPWLGLSPRDDVAERRNRPAAWAVAGALAGLTLACGGAVVAAAVLASPLPLLWPALALGTFLALWGLFQSLTGVSDKITVDRDRGAALRLAVLLPALGLLVGAALPGLQAVESAPWARALCGAALVLLVVAILQECLTRPAGPS
jgi:hypothetical protein